MAQVEANEVEVCEVDDSAIVGLRTRVLRPQLGPGQLATYAQDKDPTTSHWAARVAGEVVGCATFHLDPSPTAPAAQAVRLRGMAVAPGLQGQGIGAILMRRAMAELAARHTERLLWCNARLKAVRFYERLGFVCWGEEFEIEGIGPHYVMWRAL